MYQLSKKTIELANQIAELHRQAGSKMVDLLRSAIIDCGYNGKFGESIPTFKYQSAKDLLKCYMVSDDGMSENTFDEYCRRARLALECNIGWADTSKHKYTVSEIRQAHQLANSDPDIKGAPLTPTEKTYRALHTIEANRATAAAQAQRRINDRIEKDRRKYGDTIILPPLGIEGNANEWIDEIVNSYEGVELPAPKTPTEKLCQEFVNKAILLRKKSKGIAS